MASMTMDFGPTIFGVRRGFLAAGVGEGRVDIEV